MKLAILLVDHGSRLDAANNLLPDVAEVVRVGSPPGTIVHYAHMEMASPTIDEGIDACVKEGATEILVHPYFLGPGNHSTKDIPRLVEEAAHRHSGLRTVITEPLGLHPKLVEVVLERIESARFRPHPAAR
ncbi:MAG: sirohydrochlorin cobaltochelatase [Acidobacteria bacterium]|nr:sirohydrochlorin cobaltochelatase [Acidobacteriota bacterium]